MERGNVAEADKQFRMTGYRRIVQLIEQPTRSITAAKTKNRLYIVVQEKELAGYVSYKDRNLYIDSEGRVVEASAKKVYGVPAIQGMSVVNTQAGEVLKADSAGIFQTVLHALDTMEKYDMSASSLTVTEAGSVSVVFDNVTVILGEDHYYDLKLSKINALLPLLKGRSGIINLTTYTSETKQIILQKNL